MSSIHVHSSSRRVSYFEPEAELSRLEDSPSLSLIGEYLEPNESPVDRVCPYLGFVPEDGWIVSTGTERSFFDLALMPRGGCQGLIVRDINPRVKAYVDCLALLLRIAKNREDLISLASIDEEEAELEIQRRIEADDSLPEGMRSYYLENLKFLIKTYFGAPKKWRGDARYRNVNYFLNDKQFWKLRGYARAGRLIAILGDINELGFLSSYKINVSLVDTSNICDYFLLNLKVEGNPVIIWTYWVRKTTQYRGFSWCSLEESSQRELKMLFEKIRSFWVEHGVMKKDTGKRFIRALRKYTSPQRRPPLEVRDTIFPCYSRLTYDILRQFHAEIARFPLEKGALSSRQEEVCTVEEVLSDAASVVL